MLKTVQNKSLELAIVKKPLLFRLEKEELTQYFDKETKKMSSIEVSKRFIKKDNVGYLYEVLVKKNSIEDENDVDAYLSPLFNKILLYTNNEGKIISIPNIGEIQELWTDMRYEFKKKFKKEKDINKIITHMEMMLSEKNFFLTFYYLQTEIATLLFPPIYIKNLLNPNFKRFQHKLFHYFFNGHFLPFKLLLTSISNHKLKESYDLISRVGFISNELIPIKEIKEVFRKHQDNPFLPAEIQGEYSELFYLKKESKSIEKAMQRMEVIVDDFYTYKLQTKLSLINSNGKT